jgi:hypothetical protein
MTNLEKLKAEYKQMGETIAAMEAKDWPQRNDEYWSVATDGLVVCDLWGMHPADTGRLAQGNVFRTSEEAKRESKKRAVTKKLKDLAGDWKWANGVQKWGVYYNHHKESWETRYAMFSHTPLAIYFQTEQSAQKAIDTLGDELDVLLS